MERRYKICLFIFIAFLIGGGVFLKKASLKTSNEVVRGWEKLVRKPPCKKKHAIVLFEKLGYYLTSREVVFSGITCVCVSIVWCIFYIKK